jgi:hypothetical protein
VEAERRRLREALEAAEARATRLELGRRSLEGELQRLRLSLADQEAGGQGRQEQLNQQLSHALSSSLTNRMDRVLREEMKKTVPPSKRSHHSINGLYFNHYKGLNYSHVLFY